MLVTLRVKLFYGVRKSPVLVTSWGEKVNELRL